MCALVRTARVDRAVLDLLGGGCGALAGSVDRCRAAPLRLGLGHGFTHQPTNRPRCFKLILCGGRVYAPWALLRVSPTQ